MEETEFLNEDASLPGEYWEVFAQRRNLDPEKRLLLAVLQNGLKNYRTLVFKGGRSFAEIEGWFFGTDTDYVFSFANICDGLGLSASRLRDSLRKSFSAANGRLLPRQALRISPAMSNLRFSG